MPFYAMSDSRLITDYRPSCDVNNALMKQYNLKNLHEYRTFMQKNGDMVLGELRTQNSPDECKECPVCKESVIFGDEKPLM